MREGNGDGDHEGEREGDEIGDDGGGGDKIYRVGFGVPPRPIGTVMRNVTMSLPQPFRPAPTSSGDFSRVSSHVHRGVDIINADVACSGVMLSPRLVGDILHARPSSRVLRTRTQTRGREGGRGAVRVVAVVSVGVSRAHTSTTLMQGELITTTTTTEDARPSTMLITKGLMMPTTAGSRRVGVILPS